MKGKRRNFCEILSMLRGALRDFRALSSSLSRRDKFTEHALSTFENSHSAVRTHASSTFHARSHSAAAVPRYKLRGAAIFHSLSATVVPAKFPSSRSREVASCSFRFGRYSRGVKLSRNCLPVTNYGKFHFHSPLYAAITSCIDEVE